MPPSLRVVSPAREAFRADLRAEYGGLVAAVMDVLGVRVETPTNQPIVLLRERGSDRHLPIWIGAAEASAIAFAQQGVVPERPLTHDLMANLIEELGHELIRVRITALRDGAFFAELEVRNSDGSATLIDSRSSDAIALALRTGADIVAEEELLEEAAVTISEDVLAGEDEAATPAAGGDDVVAEFKEFLDHVSADDFDPDR